MKREDFAAKREDETALRLPLDEIRIEAEPLLSHWKSVQLADVLIYQLAPDVL